MYLAEGLTYDLAAAAVGALLGVGVAWLMASFMATLIGEFIQIEPAMTWQSLVIAYTLGVTITFITIVISSWRVSRLNIVAAIRDLPDESNPERGTRPRWQWWSSLSVAGSGLGRLLVLPIEFVWNVVLIGPKAVIWLARVLAYIVGWGPIIGFVGGLFMALGVAVITEAKR
jgi:hypothetical protein